MPGGAVELLSAMLSVEGIPQALETRMDLTGGPPKRYEEALIQWGTPGGAVVLLSAMLSVEGIAHALKARLELEGGPHKRHGEAPIQCTPALKGGT